MTQLLNSRRSKLRCAGRVNCVLLVAVGLGIDSAKSASAAQRIPTLVELFTSEGCSTCPPADAVLEKLDRLQPVAGAQVIAMSEHVDYWDHGGWKDPFSSAALTRRQESYKRRFGISEPYTPQMVVDGLTTFNGSNGLEAESAIWNAAHQPKLVVQISPAGQRDAVVVEVAPARPGFPTVHAAELYVAVAQDSGSSDVLRGENHGRRLQYTAIVRTLRRVDRVNPESGFHKEIAVHANPGQRLIAFVQESGNGKVLGSAMYMMPK
ncbi:MAG: DUF1223 domain-containing protein [Terriglobia bacterium]